MCNIHEKIDFIEINLAHLKEIHKNLIFLRDKKK